MSIIALLLAPTVRAEPPERPELPFKSVAGEDGAHVLFRNASLMNFDRDPVYAVYYDTTSFAQGLSGLTLATTGSGLGAALAYREVAPDSGWWTVSSGLSVRLFRAFAVGSTVHWQLPDGGDNNFVSWDVGAGWRPTPWLGVGTSVLNLGNPAPDFGVFTRYNGGVALRPFGDAFTLGLDVSTDDPPAGDPDRRAGASIRSRVARGLWVRAWGERALVGDGAAFGGVLEVRFSDMAVGADARTTLESPGVVGGGGYVATGVGDDQILLASRQVASFRIEGDYPYQPAPTLFSRGPESYLTLLRRLRTAARDPRLEGMILRLGTVGFSLAQVEELRGVVADARSRGTPVVAFLEEGASNGAYLLAAACDRVYAHPAGGLDLVGLSAEMQFLRGTLDLVGIDAQYAKRSEYKSAPEQWTETGPSAASREQMDTLLDDLYGVLVDGIASGRGKTADDVRGLIDRGPYSAAEALEVGLVDGLAYPDELEEKLVGVLPKSFSTDDGYAEDVAESGWAPARAVAVVVVDGVITGGESNPPGFFSGGNTGSRSVVESLDTARKVGAIKAVVLRVDSPGGSAFASDEIWRAVKKLRDAHKPVIVSMGGVAASGGYYVSAGADRILVEPSTITGSIGVFGGKFSAGKLFDKVGITSESFTRGRNAGMYALSRPMDPVEYAALDRLIGETYRQFKERVAEGRSLAPEKVEELARGRVWSGKAAVERQLADETGGFYDAVEAARKAAGIADGSSYSVITLDPWTGGGDEVPAQVARALAPKVRVPEELEAFWSLAALRDEHVFALMPYNLDIR
jgi:protease-4